jgi:RND family efflux transporter MFP subunit
VTWTSPNLVAGGYFAAGQELARIDELDYKNARDRAKSALNRAKAEVEHARFEYGRLKSLAERKLTSRSALENGLRAYRVSQAAFEDATVSFEQAEENLNRTVLRAPFDGLVKSENVDIGQFAARGQAIATLYASDIVEVRLPIADRQLAFLNLPSLRTGNLPETQQPSVTLTAEYGGRTLNWAGKIVRTEAEIDTASRMVQLVARVETQADQPGLSVGLFVNAEISGIAVEDVVVLPRSSLRNENQVLIVDGENKIRFRTVTPLRLYQDSVLIADGLVEGDRVCVSTLQTAIEGMNVNPISENADARGV